MKEQELVIIDKRGQPREPELVAVMPAPVEKPKGDPRKWVNVAFMIIRFTVNGNEVIGGRAVGLRGDGLVLCSDYIFPPLWPEDLDWTYEAKMQLTTYLGCKCTEYGPCELHQSLLQKWLQDGVMRIETSRLSQMPEAITALVEFEKRKQTGIVIPGR